MRKNSYIILAISLLISCKHPPGTIPAVTGNTNSPGTNNPNTETIAEDTALCFERDILPIFISNCAKSGCHDAASHEEGYVFTSYQTITSKDFVPGNADKTELYEKITEHKADKIMPPPPNTPLTAAQTQLIKRWINEGAQNRSNCGTLCDSNNFAFAANIQPIADKYCKGCHSGASAPKGIQLDTYDGIKNATVNGRLLDVINHRAGVTPMPNGGPKLSDCQIRQFEKWFAAGVPDN